MLSNVLYVPVTLHVFCWTCKHNTKTNTSIFSLYSVPSLMQLPLQWEGCKFWGLWSSAAENSSLLRCCIQSLGVSVTVVERSTSDEQIYQVGCIYNGHGGSHIYTITNCALCLRQYEICNKDACYEPVWSRLTSRKESRIHKNRQCVCVCVSVCVCACVWAPAHPHKIFLVFTANIHIFFWVLKSFILVGGYWDLEETQDPSASSLKE